MKIDSHSSKPQRIYLKDYSPPDFQIHQVDLYFNLDETATQVRCTQKISQLRAAPLVLNGENLTLLSVKLNGRTLTDTEYSVDNHSLSLSDPPTDFTLETLVQINPQENKSCSGLYLSKGIFATQCEAEGFRNITYFLDRPDVMTTYTVTVEADQKLYPVLLSNGDLVEKSTVSPTRHRALWKDPFKKPSYLFALVAGDLGVVTDDFVTVSGKNVKLEVYASHGKQARCHHALQSLKKAMRWDEERYGLEYDLNQYMIVSIDDFNMGAMENKGLNIFNSRLVLADPQTATDTDFERIESVVAHEYFHNWTGNRVTCRNWFELSLKEGLTVFRDQEFSADMNSRAVQRIKDVDSLRSGQFTEDAGPNSHPVRPESCLAVDNFYTATIYEKGAEVIRMMQTIVGRRGFRKGMDEYFKRHDGQAVTILDFADAIATANDADFSQFKIWYSQAGTPEVRVIEKYDPSTKTYTLNLTQSCPAHDKQSQISPFHIPLLIGLLDSQGRDMLLRSTDISFNSDEQAVLHLKKQTQDFVFENISEKPVLSLNREFSAPVKLVWNASASELLHLIRYDSDAFNRREAVYKMLLQELGRLIAMAKNHRPLKADPEVISALGYVLQDKTSDPSLKALMLQLPDQEALAQQENILQARAFVEAQSQLQKDMVAQYEDLLLALYQEHHRLQTPANRALKNRLLGYLISGQHPHGIRLAFEQFKSAQNMTDSLMALFALCEGNSSEKENALQDFYSRWSSDSVVFNKWLQVQSAALNSGTFARAKSLVKTPAFSSENPNNIYSLHMVLAENYYAMQEAGEEAYPWLCDEILSIDRINPQVAARLCNGFNFVKKFPEAVRLLVQNEIRRMLNSPTLSKNSRELLETCID